MEVPCKFIRECHPSGKTYICTVTDVDFLDHSSIESFNGKHHHGFSNVNVKEIVFKGCPMLNFPKDLMNFFPNLVTIEVYNCGLDKITKEDLRLYQRLTYLGIINNKLTHLPGDLFECIPNIKLIDFSENKIKTIGSLIFSLPKRIMGINLDYNKAISTHWIDKKDTSKTKTLDELNQIIRTRCCPLESLQTLATVKLIENINMKNMAKIYNLGERFSIPAIKRQVYNYMMKNGWKDILKENF